MPFLRRLASLLFALALFATPVSATWSIVIVDLATGEVAVGIATCLQNFNLRPSTVVVVPGYGAAAAQSFVGPLSLRELIRSRLLDGTPTSQILQELAMADPGHQGRQYGIVSLIGGETTFTGGGAGVWAGGLTGQSGTLRYAIQGNVLAGAPVVLQAEQAILNTQGSLPDKLMAAMQAARAFGGDGRCSCPTNPADSCGSPPPSFTKSAHIALMIVSRPTDLDAPCSPTSGCAGGDYWLDINISGQTAADPDPVLQLQTAFDAWKLQQVGRPDHYESTVTLSDTSIRANGAETVVATVVLKDAQGNPIGNSLPLSVALDPSSTVGAASIGPVVAQPDGSYTFTVTGDLEVGDAVLDVSVTDAVGRVGLWPRPIVALEPALGACADGAVSDGSGIAFDALRVNGVGGGDEDGVRVGFAQPFTISVDPPNGGTTGLPTGLFALWAHAGAPGPFVALPLGPGSGSLCFTPDPILAGAPTIRVADSLGADGALLAGPAPWSVEIPGLPVVADVVLQGVMITDAQPAKFAATNAILMRLVPLPSPRIDQVVPTSPLPGDLVTVNGDGFFEGIEVQVAGMPVPTLSRSTSQLTFAMPGGVPCDGVLELTNPGSPATQTTISPTPVVTNVSPGSGPAAGGATVLISGQNLGDAVATIGGFPIQIISQSPTFIVGRTPPGQPGVASVIVATPTQCLGAGSYTYF
jgi:uncharacterized Ntn-hydrolase superfamily protein